MFLSVNDGIYSLEFELLSYEKKLKHKIFLKHGGFSKSEYSSLNFSYSVGDEVECVKNNLNKVKATLPSVPIIIGKYSHGNKLHEVRKEALQRDGDYDGLITEVPFLGLAVTHADCQAGIIYDPIKHKVANIHCGWRGNTALIYTKAIQYMKDRWGCSPENMLVGISPSLGPNHSEFIHFKDEFPKHLHSYANQSSYVDLWKMTEDELISNKILPHHIEMARICTYSDSKNFFSYRRDKITGRHMTLVYLTE